MSKIEQQRRTADFPNTFNQKVARITASRQGRVLGDTHSKVHKAEQRRIQDAEFMRDLFPRIQFSRALGQMLNGAATEEDIEYVFENVHKYEQVAEGYEAEKGSKVTITIVDFTPHSTNLS